MNYRSFNTQDIAGVTLDAQGERIFSMLISIDIHDEQKSVERDALLLAYTHALLSGCGTYDRESFLNAINLLGASLEVSVNNGILSFSLTSLSSVQPKLMALFKTMLEKPTFKASEVKRITELLKNQFVEATENAKARSVEVLVDQLYGKEDRRYAFAPQELSAALSSIKQSAFKKLHAELLSKQWVCTVASDPKIVASTVTKLKSARALFSATKEIVLASDQKILSKSKVVLTPILSKQNIEISIGAPLPLHTDDKEYYAFLFGLYVLGKWGGFAGRLMSTVREKEGLTYGIYARIETASKNEYGYWRIMTFFAANKVIQGITSTKREIQAIATKGITKHEYERFKNILQTEQVLIGDSFLKRVAEMHAFQLRGYSIEQMQQYKQSLMEVEIKEVNAALKKYLHVDALVISAAGPTAAVAKELLATVK